MDVSNLAVRFWEGTLRHHGIFEVTDRMWWNNLGILGFWLLFATSNHIFAIVGFKDMGIDRDASWQVNQVNFGEIQCGWATHTSPYFHVMSCDSLDSTITRCHYNTASSFHSRPPWSYKRPHPKSQGSKVPLGPCHGGQNVDANFGGGTTSHGRTKPMLRWWKTQFTLWLYKNGLWLLSYPCTVEKSWKQTTNSGFEAEVPFRNVWVLLGNSATWFWLTSCQQRFPTPLNLKSGFPCPSSPSMSALARCFHWKDGCRCWKPVVVSASVSSRGWCKPRCAKPNSWHLLFEHQKTYFLRHESYMSIVTCLCLP